MDIFDYILSSSELIMKRLLFDGAMGTMLIALGLKKGYCVELMNVERPDEIKNIHEKYLKSGANVVSTNTFGGNRIKLKEYGLEDRVFELNYEGVKLAREIANEYNSLVAASIGPTGLFVEPVGNISFDEMYEVYKEQIGAMAKANPDFILLETFCDIGELRAALLAGKDVCDIPIICSMTYEGEKTLTGVDPKASAVILESLGASAVGVNCSGGPKELFGVARKISEVTNLPIIVQANAGLPVVEEGKVKYVLSVDDFIKEMKPYLDLGINYIGSCCGTTPEYTKAIKKLVDESDVIERNNPIKSYLSCKEEVIDIENPKIIGECINPNARIDVKTALEDGNYKEIQQIAFEQIKNGANILDVNVGIYKKREDSLIVDIINLLQNSTKTPLVIDSVNYEAIENALKAYHGKALLNSVNGNDENLNKILPLAKRYGASVVGLALDDRGIQKDARERLNIAKHIVGKCLEHGIKKEDIYIDPLALTAGSDLDSVRVSLETIKLIKEELNVKTIIGVSNISHGLFNRSLLNSSFLSMVIQNGLDLPIINPNDVDLVNIFKATSFLCKRDNNKFLNEKIKLNIKKEDKENIVYDLKELKSMIIEGNYKSIDCVKYIIENNIEKIEDVNKSIIEALYEVGNKFEKREYFLPQLMLSAEISQEIFKYIQDNISTCDKNSDISIIIGTVKGDIHDIGKNMVGVMLKSHGYNVIDVGKNIDKETFLKEAKKYNASVIGLSALMTTTMVEIPPTIEYIKKELPNVKIIVGGAVVTEEFANESMADGYSKDASSAVKLVKSLVE